MLHWVHLGYFENRIPLKPALGGVCTLANYSVAYEEAQSNRVSDFCVLPFQRQSFFFFFTFIFLHQHSLGPEGGVGNRDRICFISRISCTILFRLNFFTSVSRTQFPPTMLILGLGIKHLVTTADRFQITAWRINSPDNMTTLDQRSSLVSHYVGPTL